ncbi:hypothetical protein [Pseudomonas viridiflava]|uniref:hypothetical protein n=1 Tax=Pseudomonas viridiflava TaxID=33069 RepID=UPI000F022E28|nr:hypothetical protein [Pseudomonas viridiflava]
MVFSFLIHTFGVLKTERLGGVSMSYKMIFRFLLGLLLLSVLQKAIASEFKYWMYPGIPNVVFENEMQVVSIYTRLIFGHLWRIIMSRPIIDM